MSEENDSSGVARESSPRESAVIAVAASGDADAVAGTVLRSRAAGYKVLLLASERHHHEAITVGEQLDVPVILTELSDRSRRERVRETARELGYAGVLYHGDPSEPLDFERSSTALRESESYLIETKTSPRVKTEPTVMAGIPAYNEATTIGGVVTGATEVADEVVVVDDGSDDDTAAEARRAGATVIEHDRNRGYGAALQTLFIEAARSEAGHLVILDGDGQHDPADIPRLIEKQTETDAHLVIGSRFGDNANTEVPTYRRIGLAVVNVLTNLSLGAISRSARVSDTQSGFRAYSSEAIDSLAGDETIGEGMDASIDILRHVAENDYDVAEVSTTIDYSIDQESTRNPVTHGLQLINNILWIVERKHPILAFGVPGVVSILGGLVVGYWATFYGPEPLFSRSVLTAVFFMLAGLFSTCTAIILHSQHQHTER